MRIRVLLAVAGATFLAVFLVAGYARADTSWQSWSDNQKGEGFDAFDVGSYSADNLTLGGATFSVFGTGEIVNSPQAIATAWYVDPVNGSDSAACVASATACKTLQEINRRWRGATINASTTVNILGPLPSSDTGAWNVTISQAALVKFLGSLGPVTGFGGASIDNTLYTGTVTGFVAATDAPSATDSELTDSAIPSSYTSSGLMASGILFSDTTVNKQFYAAKDLASKTVRVTPPMLNSSPLLSSALTVGDTYKAYQLWTIYGQDFGAASANVRYDSLNDQSGSVAQSIGSSYEHRRCWYLLSGAIKSMGSQLLNCAMDVTAGGGFLSSAFMKQGFSSISGGMLLGTGASALDIQGRWEISALIMQGAIMRPDEGFLTFPGGSIGAYDTTSAIFSLHGPSSLSFVQFTNGAGNGGLCGKGNTSQLVSIESGPASVYVGYQSQLPPFSAATTSLASPILIGSTAYPVSALPALLDMSINGETVFPSTVFLTNSPPVRATFGAATANQCLALDATGAVIQGQACGGGGGTVTSVTGTAGQILCTPTSPNPVCSLIATAVTPGSYTYGSFTVDALGRLTAASSGTAPVTSIGVTDPVTTTGGTTPTIGSKFDNASITLNGGGAIQRAALTGDITATAGANATTLKNTGIGAGSCTGCSVTFDAQGRETTYSSVSYQAPIAGNTCGSNTFATQISSAGAITCNQPTIGNLANIPADTVACNPTGSPAAPSACTVGGGLVFGGSSLTMSWCTSGEVLMSAGPGVAPTCANPGHDLAGTYPSPEVVGLTDGAATDWPTSGTWANGSTLELSGGNVVAVTGDKVIATYDYNYQNASAIGGFGGLWAMTGGYINNAYINGGAFEYAPALAAGHARIVANIVLNNLSGAGTGNMVFSLTRNGSTIGSVTVTNGNTGVFASSTITVSAGAFGDTYGMFPTGTAATGSFSGSITVNVLN